MSCVGKLCCNRDEFSRTIFPCKPEDRIGWLETEAARQEARAELAEKKLALLTTAINKIGEAVGIDIARAIH